MCLKLRAFAILFLSICGNLCAMQKLADCRINLETVGEVIFDRILSTLSDQILDTAALHGTTENDFNNYNRDAIIGIIKSSGKNINNNELGFIEILDNAAQEIVIQAVNQIPNFSGMFNLVSFQLVVRGKGITTHGNFLYTREPNKYQADITLDQLPYASLNKAIEIAKTNTLYYQNKSLTDYQYEVESVNRSGSCITVIGKLAIKLHLIGHSSHALEHDLEFELRPVEAKV